MKYILPAILLLCGSAHAQGSGKPVEVVADTLEVLQEQNKAIFTGNVIATQGPTVLNSHQMVVFYRNGGGDSGAMGDGIYRIEASGNVLVTTPTETAKGDVGVYNVDTETIDLEGNVLLTRDKNVLKGTKLNYNMATGRSVLTGGGAVTAADGSTTSGGRVRGLFIPKGSDGK